ncbi:MAG: ABC transporter domain-containing protein [Lachnoclostridium sp.]|jgi:ABC-2 type transport system ATP-binding protein
MQRIIAQNIQKSIDNKMILQMVNLFVNQGEICALIGPNGAGKTTLIKCLLGLVYPENGSIQINGQTLSDKRKTDLLKNIGSVLQYPESISHLTVNQLFMEHFHYLNMNPSKKWEEFLQKVGLNVSGNMQIGKMSLGMKQRLLFAMALSHSPNIIILDEPFNGLDIDGINLIKDMLKDLTQNGISILIASHSLSELEDIATSVVFMLNGRTYEKKNVKEIKRQFPGGLKEYYQHIKKGISYEAGSFV